MKRINFFERGLVISPPSLQNQSGRPLCTFDFMWQDSWKKESGEFENYGNYIKCKLWGDYAEILFKRLIKNLPVLIYGRIRHERWEAEGKKISALVLMVHGCEKLGERINFDKKAETQKPEDEDMVQFGQEPSEPFNDDIPSELEKK